LIQRLPYTGIVRGIEKMLGNKTSRPVMLSNL